MLHGTLLGIPLYDMFYTFFIYSIAGWIYESTMVSIRDRKWINRGFLNGPLIPIYGCGGMLMVLTFYNPYMITIVKDVTILHIIIVFLIGMILASILEYVTSYAMEKMFHAKWWDYSDYPLNLQGRISLRSSLLWGAMSVAVVFLAQPPVNYMIARFRRPLGDIVLYALIVTGVVDLYLTIRVTLHLNAKLEAVEKLKEILFEYSEGIRWYDKIEEWKEKIESNRWIEHMRIVRNNRLHNAVYQRLFKAFPRMKVKDHQQIFDEFRKKLKNIRR